MKDKIIEIVEFGNPQSLIQRENAPITELIKTDILIEELNRQLRLYDIMQLLPDGDKINKAADEYGFRVPYDGSNTFYDYDVIKHFIAGVRFVEGVIKGQYRIPRK